MQFSDYQNLASSEKIVLATLDASKRLMGWTLHSGSIYKLTNFEFPVIVSLEDSGNAYNAVSSLGAVTASKYYLDTANQTLYVRTTGSDNPNGRFMVVTVRKFFANVPLTLPNDLDAGFEVYWEPTVKATSQFGVEIDTINQTSQAIEGSGSLTLFNDYDFWPANFDKLTFENQACKIYSYHRDLDATEAQLIFSGRVEKKSYGDAITFNLKDIISELRAPLALGTIADLGLRTGSDLDRARQRLILGRVFGHVPVNVDQVLDGYPLTGTVSATYNSATLTGSSTTFLTQLSPDDRVILDGEEYTIASVASDTSATLTENYSVVAGLAGATAYVIPDQPKRWMNRVWHIAGHPLREPVTAVANGSSIIRLIVDDASDIYADDWIYIGTIGSGELVQVDSVVGSNVVNLRTSLATIPAIGTTVTRPAVQNVRIDDTLLVYYQDYTLDADAATLTLRSTAESNSGPIRNLTSNLSFTSGSRAVTGTNLRSFIKPGYMVGVTGNANFFEVLSVDSDTGLTLRSNASFTANTTGRYKSLVLNPDDHVLSLDVLGKTEDDTTNGTLLKTAPSMVKGILADIGLDGLVNQDSFDAAEGDAPQHLGLVFPATYSDDGVPTYRDIINEINASVFGNLVQNSEFELTYNVLQPNKPTTSIYFEESDILSIKFDSSGENLVKTVVVEYRPKEYDYLTDKDSVGTQQKTSDIANYLVKTTREKVISSKLVEQTDANIAASRWAFILENGAGRATIRTKLKGITIDVGSTIEVSHRKLFERVGTGLSSRLFLVEAVKKTGTDVQLEVVDLSNAFARVATWNNQTNEYALASDREKLYGGYYTDDYGLIDNDPESFGANLYW